MSLCTCNPRLNLGATGSFPWFKTMGRTSAFESVAFRVCPTGGEKKKYWQMKMGIKAPLAFLILTSTLCTSSAFIPLAPKWMKSPPLSVQKTRHITFSSSGLIAAAMKGKAGILDRQVTGIYLSIVSAPKNHLISMPDR